MAITAVLRFCDVSSSVTAAPLAIGTVLVCLHQLTETAVPISIGVIIDRAVETSDTTALIVSIVGLAALFLVLTAAWRFGARFIVTAMQQEAHRLRLEVAHRVLDPRGVRTDLRSGELLTVSTSDAEQTSWIADIVPRAAAALTAAVASAVALVWIDLWLGLAVLIGTPVILGLLQLAGASHHVEGHRSAGVDRSGVGDGYGSGQRIASAARYRRREDRVGALPHGQPSSARIDDRHGQGDRYLHRRCRDHQCVARGRCCGLRGILRVAGPDHGR